MRLLFAKTNIGNPSRVDWTSLPLVHGTFGTEADKLAWRSYEEVYSDIRQNYPASIPRAYGDAGRTYSCRRPIGCSGGTRHSSIRSACILHSIVQVFYDLKHKKCSSRHILSCPWVYVHTYNYRA
jgi:hypothetical protein